MRARDLVGRRITRVLQQRVQSTSGEIVWGIDGIVLDNGKAVAFVVVELEGDYAVEGLVVDAPRSEEP